MKPATRKTPRRLWEIEAEKDDYRAIAVRRVRLGLLLSEIGQSNGVEVSGQEMQMLVQQAAQQYRPEDRQRFAEYIQNEPWLLPSCALRCMRKRSSTSCSTRPK
jgi:FKBP-type peptidyl-prolyl cis-trans isomerase (trigger factor)